MRLFILVQDSSFFLPRYLDRLLGLRRGDEIEVAVASRRFKGKSRWFHWKLQLTLFGPIGAARLGVAALVLGLLDMVGRIVPLVNCYSVRAAAAKHAVTCGRVDERRDDLLEDRLRAFQPDVVIAHVNRIIPARLLKIASRGWLNSHSSLLPKYRGIHPIFWALLNGETTIGVTVHWMNEAVDSGLVIGQVPIAVDSADTVFTLYEKCFDALPGLMDRALSSSDACAVPERMVQRARDGERYWSFPSAGDVRRFRRAGKRVV